MTNRTQPGDAQESWSSGEDYGETWHRKAKNRDVPTKAKFQTVRFTWQQHKTTNTSLSTQEHVTHLAPVSWPIGLNSGTPNTSRTCLLSHRSQVHSVNNGLVFSGKTEGKRARWRHRRTS